MRQRKISMALPIELVLHMNGGNDDSSYANNSLFQKTVIEKTIPVLKRVIKGMGNQDAFPDHCFMIADLGCSSGMNTLLVVSNIIDAVHETCQENDRATPQFQVFLNDLIGNDFNSLFKLLPDFYKLIKNVKGENFGPCFISAVPGSFYNRLFPDKSLHLIHSSYSIHWLSQVPEGIENNKSNIYIATTSPPNVFQAYKNQFCKDFTKFLQLRHQEMICGGCMVLTLRGRSSLDPTNDDDCSLWELLGLSLLDMAIEGLVQETKVNSFNIPFYFPHEGELRNIIEGDGLFSIDHMNIFEAYWDPQNHDDTNMNEFNDPESSYNHGKYIANLVRAITEPLLASHFRNSIIDVLFIKFGKKVVEHLGIRKIRKVTILVSLTKI